MIFKNNAKIKYNLQEELKIVFIKFKFIFLFTLFLFFQFSIEAFASTNLNSISNVKKVISFKDFEKEFILTTSLESYIRSLYRLENHYNIRLSNKTINKVYKNININIKEQVEILISSLIKNTWLKANFKKNEYYSITDKIRLLANEINVAAYIEILLVKEQTLVGSKAVVFAKHNSYFFYLIDHVRYEVLNKTLYDSVKF